MVTEMCCEQDNKNQAGGRGGQRGAQTTSQCSYFEITQTPKTVYDLQSCSHANKKVNLSEMLINAV